MFIVSKNILSLHRFLKHLLSRACIWKDAGVVDRTALEMRRTREGTQGSNPCLSAAVKDLSSDGSLFFSLDSDSIICEY